MSAREEAIRSLGTQITREALLDKVVESALAGEHTKVEAMVAVARPAVDYMFYQQLTERLEAAQQAGDTTQADALRALRETILELTAQIDASIQQATEQAAQLLEKIIDSDDPERTLRANLPQMDELFLSVLQTSLDAAEKSGQQERAERLQKIGDVIMNLLEELQPPQIRLTNQLLGADYPDGTRALLEDNRQSVDAELLEIMQLVQEDLSASGQGPLAERLARIREQAAAMVEGTG
jgi:hypothetical protein